MKAKHTLCIQNFKVFLIAVFIFAIASAVPARAQVPDKFYNLKVLPLNIKKDKLVDIMRNFSRSLGVHCDFCHVSERTEEGRKTDFQSDDKPEKRTARLMMKMATDINADYISKISSAGDKDDIVKVRCVTCHRGRPLPQMLEDVLAEEIEDHGIDSAIAKYHQLYKEFYGGFEYDFRAHTLVNLTEELVKTGKNKAAMAISKLNVDMYPNSAISLYGLAEAYEANGDKGNALLTLKKASEIMPDNREIMRKMKELEGD